MRCLPLLAAIAWLIVWVPVPGPAQADSAPVEVVLPEWLLDSFLDLSEDIETAASEGKGLALVYHQQGCPYCRHLFDQVLADPDLQSAFRQRHELLALDLFGDLEVIAPDGRSLTEKAFARERGVQFTPTMVFLDAQGAPRLRIDGLPSAAMLADALAFLDAGGRGAGDFTAWRDARAAASPARQAPAGWQRVTTAPEDGRVALLLEAGACERCDDWREQVLADLAVVEALAPFERQFSDAPPLRAALGAAAAPTLILFDQGQAIERATGELRPFHTRVLLDYVGSGAWREQPDFQRYLNGRASELRAAGEAVVIWPD